MKIRRDGELEIQRVVDDFQSGEVLAEQTGIGGVLTFTFSSTANLVVVESSGANLVSRADPFGGTPDASTGWPCRDEVPTFFPVTTGQIKVYAPSGAVINVMGYFRS